MTYAAQCLTCKHARHLDVTAIVVGCSRFTLDGDPSKMSALNSLVYQNAAKNLCPVKESDDPT